MNFLNPCEKSDRGFARSSLLALLASALILSPLPAAAEPRLASCPDRSIGESTEDCPWGAVARTLAREAAAGKEVRPLLEELVPDLTAQIQVDASRTAIKRLWGESINFDEHAGGIIVLPEILDALTDLARVPRRQGRIVHAGIEHTYGYLFSTLQTSFGFKRARWVRDDIESGFGFARGTLGPFPREGTFFSNVTHFIGRIAFRDAPGTLLILDDWSGAVARDILDYPYDRLKVKRMEETILLRDSGSRRSRTVTIRTDLVPFTVGIEEGRGSKGNTHLLIYSYEDTLHPEPKLITAFPVDTTFVKWTLDPRGLGTNEKIQTRYNAHIPGLTDATRELRGTRKVYAD